MLIISMSWETKKLMVGENNWVTVKDLNYGNNLLIRFIDDLKQSDI